MNAWQFLIAGSTLSSGTAWQHLNAQGGAGNGDVFVYGEIGVELVQQQYEIEMPGDFEVELVDDLTVELEDECM